MHERLMIFSFDGHVGGPPESYLDYIEPRYREDLEALRAENDEWAAENELRLILGENAVTCLGIDPAPLHEVARRIGPRPSDVLDPTTEVDPGLVENFNKRSGFAKPREDVDPTTIDGWLTPDLVPAG